MSDCTKCDREHYVQDMANWKESAQAKDKQIHALNDRILDLEMALDRVEAMAKGVLREASND